VETTGLGQRAVAVRAATDGGRRAALRRVLARTRTTVRRRDLALTSAGAALFGALAVVPSMLVAVSLAGVLLGEDAVRGYGRRLADSLPSAMGAPAAVEQVLGAGLALSPLGVFFAVFMGSAYGDGLSRALLRYAPVADGERQGGLLLRAATLPLLGLAPLMLCGMLVASPGLARLVDREGVGGVALASYLSLTLVWVLTWAPLTWTFRVVGPGHPSWRSALVGAVVTGAFVSGFLQGFLVFLALPVDLGRPFGGLAVVGITTGLLLWLWVLHAVVLVGYAFTWALDTAWGTAREVVLDLPEQAPADGPTDRSGDDGIVTG